MARGVLLVTVHDASGLTLDTPVQLELVLPDGRPLIGQAQVLQGLAGFGGAVRARPPPRARSAPSEARGDTREARSARNGAARNARKKMTECSPTAASTPAI